MTPAVRKVKRTVTVWLCVCQRCRHAWESFQPKPPQICARCKYRNWQRPALFKHK